MYTMNQIADLRQDLIHIVNERGAFGESLEADAVGRLHSILMIYSKEEDLTRELESWSKTEKKSEISKIIDILYGPEEDLPLYLSGDYKPVVLWRLHLINDCEVAC